MDIKIITDEIRTKLTHAVNSKSKAYAKTISSLPEDEQESLMSTFITDMTFEISEKVVKDKMGKMNPKPITFSFYINRGKYFQQTMKELTEQLVNEVFCDDNILQEELKKQENTNPFVINFTGHFLKDYGYIGKKDSNSNEKIQTEWFPSILNCLKAKDEGTDEETLNILKEFITIGFGRALNQTYVFVDNQKIEDSINTLDYVIFNDKQLSPEEFNSFRKSLSIGNKN